MVGGLKAHKKAFEQFLAEGRASKNSRFQLTTTSVENSLPEGSDLPLQLILLTGIPSLENKTGTDVT